MKPKTEIVIQMVFFDNLQVFADLVFSILGLFSLADLDQGTKVIFKNILDSCLDKKYTTKVCLLLMPWRSALS